LITRLLAGSALKVTVTPNARLQGLGGFPEPSLEARIPQFSGSRKEAAFSALSIGGRFLLVVGLATAAMLSWR
jgi:hypothetical protein